MRISVIPVHSFVDLITNSSSEVFVCSTDKSVEVVKAILGEISWGFGEIYAAEHDVNVDNIPKKLLAEHRDWDWNGPRAKEMSERYHSRCKQGETSVDVREETLDVSYRKYNNAYEAIKEWANKTYESQETTELYDLALTYNFRCEKGDIIAWSEGDNTVPYDAWDRINCTLNARNWHIG